MEYYLFDTNGDYVGMRGSLPNEEENLTAVEQNSESLQKMTNYLNPKLISGEIIETATDDDILQLKNTLRQQIYAVYDSLFESSLARALDKVGQGLTLSQMQSLKQEYELKKAVALDFMYLGTADAGTMDLIEFECDVDFAEPRLSNEVAYLNQILVMQNKPEIPVGQSRLFQYCNLIVVKYDLGSALWSTLKSLCATFRSKLITDLDNGHFNRIHKRIALIKTINNETTVAEILALQPDFDALTND